MLLGLEYITDDFKKENPSIPILILYNKVRIEGFSSG